MAKMASRWCSPTPRCSGYRTTTACSRDSWRVTAGGALAVQVPGNYDAEAHRSMREVASRFPGTDKVREWFTHRMEFYYDLVAPLAARVELWATEYVHVMNGPEDIVDRKSVV